MEIYDLAKESQSWEAFYEAYSSNEHAYNSDIKRLRSYIDDKRYLTVTEEYEKTSVFPVPKLMLLNKKGTEKKRAVFAFDNDTSWLLKFFGFYLHGYDNIFSNSLYSFRKERSVKTAVAALMKNKNIPSMYGVKLDIHDYFNSADTSMIIDKLKNTLNGQQKLFKLIEGILTDPYVYVESGFGNEKKKATPVDSSQGDERKKASPVDSSQGDERKNASTVDSSLGNEGKKVSPVDNNFGDGDKIISPVHKGMMAGSPLSPFLANLYLNELDIHLEEEAVFYARYSDDIILFDDSEEKLKQEMDYILEQLQINGLSLNPDKLQYIQPDTAFEFLGFSFCGNEVDVAKASFEKIKKKLKRKVRAVNRWKIKKKADPEKAVKVYIRYFNRKFFENPVKSELTWCRWYFPVITTDVTIKEIDHYMQECIRFLYTGKYSKRNFNLRYEDIKKLGYRSLVNEYHKSV